MRNSKLLIFIPIAAALVSTSFFLPTGEWIVSFIQWVKGYGVFGAVMFGILYITMTILMIPGSFLTLGAGFLYGPWWGLLLISPASVTGATLAFICGRYLLRDWVMSKLSNHPKFNAVDKAIERQGFKIVGLLRLSPLFPFNLLNYALGTTGVGLGSYITASFLGMLPGTLLYLYIGSLATSLTNLSISGVEESSAMKWLLYILGLMATVVVAVLVTRFARSALSQELNGESSSSPSPRPHYHASDPLQRGERGKSRFPS